MLDTPVASDRSYEVFQLRRERGELGPCALDSVNRKLHRVSGYRQFIGDVDDAGDSANPNPNVLAAVPSGDESDTE